MRREVSDEEVCQWGERHDIGLSGGDLRSAFDDAASVHMIEGHVVAEAEDVAPAGYQPLAVTDLPHFPTMLRQMYSGGAVQSWIDDNIKPLIQERHHAFHCDALAAPAQPDDTSLETGEGDAHGY